MYSLINSIIHSFILVMKKTEFWALLLLLSLQKSFYAL